MMSFSSKTVFVSLILVFECILFSNGVIIPESCRINSTVFDFNATYCSDVRDPAQCKAFFPGGAASGIRPPQCEKIEMESIALDCAKTCFACCETVAFSCGNDPLAPINCFSNARYCADDRWTDVMLQYCRGTCGKCVSETGCVDVNTRCKEMRSLCNNIDFKTYMHANCQKTCLWCPYNDSFYNSRNTPSGNKEDLGPIKWRLRQLYKLYNISVLSKSPPT